MSVAGRKAQNNAAQRAFREHKEQHITDLETEIDELRKAGEAAGQDNALLKDQLERQVERLRVELGGEHRMREYRMRLASTSQGEHFARESDSTHKRAANSSDDFQSEKVSPLPQSKAAARSVGQLRPSSAIQAPNVGIKPSSGRAKRVGPLTQEERRMANKVRDIGACLRCQRLRERCTDSRPCLGCYNAKEKCIDRTLPRVYWGASGFTQLGGELDSTLLDNNAVFNDGAQLACRPKSAENRASSSDESISSEWTQYDGLTDPTAARIAYVAGKVIASAFASVATRYGAQQSQATGGSCASGQPRGGKKQPQPASKRKSTQSRDDDSEASNDDGSPKKRKTDQKRRQESSAPPLLACPFHKFDCKYFGPDSDDEKYHACAKVRFTNVAGLKQHMQRNHCLPKYYCVNCCEAFPAESQLHAHIRPPRCETLDPPLYPDRITAQLSEALRLDEREPKNQDSSHYWRHAYDVLFPGAAALVSVSPNYEGPDKEHTLRFIRFAKAARSIILARIVQEEQRLNPYDGLHTSTDRMSEEIDSIVLDWYWNHVAPSGLVLGECIGSHLNLITTVQVPEEYWQAHFIGSIDWGDFDNEVRNEVSTELINQITDELGHGFADGLSDELDNEVGDGPCNAESQTVPDVERRIVSDAESEGSGLLV
ncbi:uncharacterized protein AB675_370 [Cyphellophora attinorum]|uniref:C2H2-type domain-containing protein n=1 Tax=Cyphellophora attinorum TaxID=1664694 RepID=A0A0N1HID7_9EURO|nr:uncharacterized protein AB675_370 [Phialophora attinorum]KPI46075.1 hypothetical protein AB675_370 [Phialophora attinorum]